MHTLPDSPEVFNGSLLPFFKKYVRDMFVFFELIHREVVQFTLCGMSYGKGWISQQYLLFEFEVIYGWRWFYGV